MKFLKLSPKFNTVSASYFRDQNRVPLTTDGIISTDSRTFVGNNATVNVPIFGFTGVLEIRGLWGVVTTTLGANHTASSWRINDQTAQVYLTAVGGASIGGYTPGSMIYKGGLVATALTAKSAAAGYITEPAATQMINLTPVIIGDKTTLTNNTIEYHYATTDTPTSGAMTFFLRWLPMSNDASVTSL
jgi:hypothetical protein